MRIKFLMALGAAALLSTSIPLWSAFAQSTPGRVVLPVEVFTRAGAPVVVERSFIMPQTHLGAAVKLYLQIHNLEGSGVASVQFNNGPWVALTDTTVTIDPRDARFGTLGLGLATKRLTLPLPAGLVAGTNVLRFKVEHTRRTVGYRVLTFNIRNSSDGNLLSSSNYFVQENPANWLPPYSDAANIAQGQQLWQSGALRRSVTDTAPIRATCADCHLASGRDLKYFNYSNGSIVARSLYHGLTEEQGKQVASYIRTLNVPNPGRPWNPPYQPNSTLDSQPVSSWAAGGGLGAVLANDADSLLLLFPGGIDALDIDSTKTLNLRQTRIFLPLPDWNHWLPSVHPKDAFGSAFDNSPLRYRYDGLGTVPAANSGWNGFAILPALRGQVAGVDPSTYARGQLASDLHYWGARQALEFLNARRPTTWTSQDAEAFYATMLWLLVKTFEFHQEFNLEELGSAYFGSQSEPRTWFNRIPALANPSRTAGIPRSDSVLAGTPLQNSVTYEYLGTSWYYLQDILDANNRNQSGTLPIDWGYFDGTIASLGGRSGYPEMSTFLAHRIKGLQNQDNGRPPSSLATGMDPWNQGDVGRLVRHPYIWQGTGAVSSDTKRQLLDAFMQAWLKAARKFTPSEYYAQGAVSPTETYTWAANNPASKMGTHILLYEENGAPPERVRELRDFAYTLWPHINWDTIQKYGTSP